MNSTTKDEPAEIFGFVPADADKPKCRRIGQKRYCLFQHSRCTKVSQHQEMPPNMLFRVCSVWQGKN